ncbi:Core histone macro-H2A.1 [Hondaea fermentalgiana]|uniref:Core histone macro-H2A.1 n=1 Tax=Hondaea fermentalgiana TaxID=2315210 RepID=A0A2R5GFX0_9STRA|nr:Core histone macro-H2A.1 [Hondaea fermentalgiana]|eukprot:GBG29495.1 Core histone macro-H2A.1 [Hondaea fermentalgiana]
MAAGWRRVRRVAAGVEIWRVRDVVSPGPSSHAHEHVQRVLVNPANERLEGTKCPYFPRGGPLPVAEQHGWTSGWGGMEAGPNMLYPAQTIDGRVHAEGGAALREDLRNLQAKANGAPLELGSAVRSSAPGRLADLGFDAIVHVAVPFCDEPEAETLLQASFFNGLACAFGTFSDASEIRIVDLPLLGSGARGFSRQASVMALSRALGETKVPTSVRLRLVVADAGSDDAATVDALANLIVRA